MGRLVLVVWLLGTVSITPTRAGAQPFFQGLGTAGLTRAVSGDGSTVVGETLVQGFRWTREEGLQPLGFLPGKTSSTARGVSVDGSAVVGSSAGAGVTEAYRWTALGGMQPLGDLEGGRFRSSAADVSDDGSVVVGNSDGAVGTQAFRWTGAGGMVGLPGLPFGGAVSDGGQALGVSADGRVVVGEVNPEVAVGIFGQRAVRWVDGGEPESLGTLPGRDSSIAFGVSSDASTIVGLSSLFEIPPTDTEAFRWQDGEIAGLGVSGLTSIAWATNGDGSIVVGGGTTSDSAFLWTAEGGLQDLAELLEVKHGLDLSGWALFAATGISDDGRTLAGIGQNPVGAIEGWVAMLPDISLDTDADGVRDHEDNCTEVPNGPLLPDAGGNVQLDSDGDGYGNVCDGDFDQGLPLVGFPDLVQMRQAFGRYRDSFDCLDDDGSAGASCAEFDLDGDLPIIGFPDLARFRQLLGRPPGPKCPACPLEASTAAP